MLGQQKHNLPNKTNQKTLPTATQPKLIEFTQQSFLEFGRKSMHILLKTTPCTGLIRNKRKIKITNIKFKGKDSLGKQMLKDIKYFLKSIAKKKL